MTPKKKKSKSQQSQYHRRKHGSVFTLGQVLIILGAALMIAAALAGIIYEITGGQSGTAWYSSSFGLINVYLGAAVAIAMAIIIIWLAVDKRIYYKLNLYLYAIVIMVIALVGGNIGAVLVLIGGVVIIFYKISRSS